MPAGCQESRLAEPRIQNTISAVCAALSPAKYQTQSGRPRRKYPVSPHAETLTAAANGAECGDEKEPAPRYLRQTGLARREMYDEVGGRRARYNNGGREKPPGREKFEVGSDYQSFAGGDRRESGRSPRLFERQPE